MIAFPAAAALIAFACAAFVGWDAVRRPRPERVIWVVAFLVFAVAASAEVIGSAVGWSSALARVYYLAGAVLVVGILALGELYLLLPGRMLAFAPGITLLIVAIAATAVWSAPVDTARLPVDGWAAIERGLFLVALTATINALGTLVLVGGALYSARTPRAADGSRKRTAGCLCIALGTVVVAVGGTLTRLGQPAYLYLAMSLGITIIFAGVLLTRSPSAKRIVQETATKANEPASLRAGLISLPARPWTERAQVDFGEGMRFMVENLLPLDDAEIGEACRRWSAGPVVGDAFTRTQANQVWALRQGLPDVAKSRFDRLPHMTRAQLAELYAEVWSNNSPGARDQRRA